MYPVTVLLHVLGQLLVFLLDFAVLLFPIVLMQMCILLYYWANKMMMMMMICTRWLAAVIFTFSSLIIITALYCVFFSIFDFVCHMLHGYYCNRVHEERQTYSQITLHTQQYAVSVMVCRCGVGVGATAGGRAVLCGADCTARQTDIHADHATH